MIQLHDDFKYRRTATKACPKLFFFLIGEVLIINVNGIFVVGIKHLTDIKIWKGDSFKAK